MIRPCAANPALFDDRLDTEETPYDRGVRHGKAIQICSTCPRRLACYVEGGVGIIAGQLRPDTD
jgi:hypothetical protein